MLLKQLYKGITKYVKGYYAYAKGIEGMSQLAFTLDGIWCRMRYGCVFNQYTEGGFYKHTAHQRRRILTYRHWKRLVRLNDPAQIHYLKNKVDFNMFFKDFIGREWLDTSSMKETNFMSFAQKHEKAIVKPIDEWEGNGIRVIDLRQEDKKQLSASLKAFPLLIEEIVEQHPLMVFNNCSVNTIRVYTVFDDKEKKAHIIKTTLRAGVGTSIVDNSHSGGCSYEVDIDTGRIDSFGWSHTRTGMIFHPGSDICMLGREIPYWEKAKDMVKQAAERLPSVKFIGWDVAILRNGPILIEGNHDPDLDIMEFVGHSGYLPIIKKHVKF